MLFAQKDDPWPDRHFCVRWNDFFKRERIQTGFAKRQNAPARAFGARSRTLLLRERKLENQRPPATGQVLTLLTRKSSTYRRLLREME
jgi:hypothetical protein